jgi:hypothetical protein
MGIDKDGLVFLEACRHFIKSPDSILTIGRLRIYAPKQAIRRHIPNLKVELSSIEYLDELLRQDFGCRVDALDLSDYQGATIPQDLNSPVPPELKNRFDLIVESGTLEHIMDFKQAAESLGEMTKVGGYLAIITPTNGYVGHGFFQINPDFFYSFFSPENGFEVVTCLMKFAGSRPWLHHPNPVEDIGFRAEFRSRRYIRTFLLIKKVDVAQVHVTNSFDYEKIWQADKGGISWKGKLYNRTPSFIQRFLRFINGIRVRRAIFKKLTRIGSKNLPSFVQNR